VDAITNRHASCGESEQTILSELKIDVEKLGPFELRATLMKVRRLGQMRGQNDRLFSQVSRLEQIRAGVAGLPPGVPILMKLFDEDTSRTVIHKVTSDYTSDEIADTARDLLNRPAMLSVHVSPTRTEALTPESLRDAHSSICKEEQKALIIRAL
jgi:hypothetical protein